MQKRVRAIIIEDGKLISIRRDKINETYWVFPGGGVESGESDIEALKRECKEELGVDVEVGDIFAEYEFRSVHFGTQKEYFYLCKIIGGELGTGDGPEYEENNHYEGTHCIEHLAILDLEYIDLRPHNIRDMIIKKYGNNKD